MEKLSGLVLDVYDDPRGEVLKTIFPSLDSVPDLVKTAHQVTPELRDRLPDDAFALILEQNGTELRKFATVDAGNTALSVEYFLKTAHKLPEEAQKVAAHNLCVACGWFGIEPPEELQKVAGFRRASRVAAASIREGSRASREDAQRAYNKVLRRMGKPEFWTKREAHIAAGGRVSPVDIHNTPVMGKAKQRRFKKESEELSEIFKKMKVSAVRGRGLGPGKGKGPFRGTGLGPGTGECMKKAEQEVTVSRIPKVRERQLEALKSRGIEGPTKTAAKNEWELGPVGDMQNTKFARFLEQTGRGRYLNRGGTPKKGTAEWYDLAKAHKDWMSGASPIKKTSMAKQAIGVLPLAMGAMVVPGAVSEAGKNLRAAKTVGGGIVTPEQLRLQRQRLGLV